MLYSIIILSFSIRSLTLTISFNFHNALINQLRGQVIDFCKYVSSDCAFHTLEITGKKTYIHFAK